MLRPSTAHVFWSIFAVLMVVILRAMSHTYYVRVEVLSFCLLFIIQILPMVWSRKTLAAALAGELFVYVSVFWNFSPVISLYIFSLKCLPCESLVNGNRFAFFQC